MAEFHLYLGHGFIVIGQFFIFTAILGLKRLPDTLSKIHASGIADSLGFPLCYFGLALVSLGKGLSGKYLLLAIFILIISPVTTHSLAKMINDRLQKGKTDGS